jgi:hypothetical protein
MRKWNELPEEILLLILQSGDIGKDRGTFLQYEIVCKKLEVTSLTRRLLFCGNFYNIKCYETTRYFTKQQATSNKQQATSDKQQQQATISRKLCQET